MKQTTKKTLSRMASFGLLAISAVALSPSAMAWSPWGSWAAAGTAAKCSGKAGQGTPFDCSGTASASGNSLLALAPTKQCGQSTQAYGWPKLSNGNYPSVIAAATDSTGSNTASITTPHTLTHSICRCEFTIC